MIRSATLPHHSSAAGMARASVRLPASRCLSFGPHKHNSRRTKSAGQRAASGLLAGAYRGCEQAHLFSAAGTLTNPAETTGAGITRGARSEQGHLGFLELWSMHARAKTLTERSKQLAALVQKVTDRVTHLLNFSVVRNPGSRPAICGLLDDLGRKAMAASRLDQEKNPAMP